MKKASEASRTPAISPAACRSDLHLALGPLTNKAGFVTVEAQNISFKPNWTCRGVVASVVISPADRTHTVVRRGGGSLFTKTIALGLPRLVRLNRLKISARNWRFMRSLSFVFLKTDKSKSPRPGPEYTPRPKFPQVPGAGRLRRVRVIPLGLGLRKNGSRETGIDVGAVRIAGIAIARTVRADLGREGESAEDGRNLIHLPSSDEIFSESALVEFRKRFPRPNGS